MNATLLDRAIVGVQMMFELYRGRAFFSLITSLIAGVVMGMAAQAFGSRLIDSIRRMFSELIVSKAYAAVGAHDGFDPIQLYIVAVFSGLIAFGFVWFAAVACLSAQPSTRKAAMDMARQVLVFMTGLVAGYLAKR
ncbi:hypothetical protein EOW77_0006290 [Bradyrhizobium yuanmingense]|uniref:hypothetical protein n=1 Tax=Bradyrhizobium yuanmingense TaxID=108015 RepID=UPI000FE3CF90|nr:hypothetical protein [Bradyrhizobium yuanmingense]TGN89904.1 hypothetical protein EOW77_0006290 [Bradyrhizobium yuanmingense]